jgi:hypothetical protein
MSITGQDLCYQCNADTGTTDSTDPSQVSYKEGEFIMNVGNGKCVI